MQRVRGLIRQYGDHLEASSKLVESAIQAMEEPQMALYLQVCAGGGRRGAGGWGCPAGLYGGGVGPCGGWGCPRAVRVGGHGGAGGQDPPWELGLPHRAVWWCHGSLWGLGLPLGCAGVGLWRG